MRAVLAIALMLAACGKACDLPPDPCTTDGGHWVKYDCHDEWHIDLQPQADGTISDFSHSETVCSHRCELSKP